MICTGLTREQSNKLYLEVLEDKDKPAIRQLCQNDLFFLLTIGCKRKDIDRDWLYDRCREVEANPNGHLDLWSREHYKSTLITFGKSIQDILSDPDYTTIGIFSHTRPIAKGFLEQIKRELEGNSFLKGAFPDVLYENPRSEAPKWSLDSGIIVKRKTNPKEATVEAWGLVDGQPTGKHFFGRVYDDVVTRESVTTPDQIKKTTESWELSLNLGSDGGWARYIGTRYHFNDTYRAMMDRGSVIPRIFSATDNGKIDGNPVLLSKEKLLEKRRDMGPYTFNCFPKDSPVLMSDWTEKPINKIKVGDTVVGYSFPKGARSKLTKSKVIAIKNRKAEVFEAILESGRKVRCTKDHKWYTGRRGKDVGGTDSHLAYAPLGFHKNNTKALISVYESEKLNQKYSLRDAGWIGGMFDGEGSLSGKSIHIHQSCEENLPVCEQIEKSLKELNFDYGLCEQDRGANRQNSRDYYIRGGRSEKIRFLNWCKPSKSWKIIESLYEEGTRNFGKVNRDKLVSFKSIGTEDVFNIQTETGNYICYGYATKNCQMMQNPVSDNSMGFKEEWLTYYEKIQDTEDWNKYILVDPASKKKSNSDYTVMEVIGLAPDNNYYLLDAVRDRLNLTERTNKLFELVRVHKPIKVGYEQYGLQSDIEHMKYVMEQENYRFKIVALGGSLAKEDRIKRLVPIFEQNRFYMPRTLHFFDYEKKRVDYIQSFIDDEYLSFPVCIHDDMLDCRARILDPGLAAKFPEIEDEDEDSDQPSLIGTSGLGWMG